jgi:hypothetical protein
MFVNSLDASTRSSSIIFVARWDFPTSPLSPPRTSAILWTFELLVGTSSCPNSWQKSVLRCGKKIGWLLCFAMFFSAKLFDWKFMPLSCHLLPLPLHDFQNPMPHAPCCAYHVFNLTTRKRSRTIDHVSAEICVFLIGQLFNSKSSTCLTIFCNSPPL